MSIKSKIRTIENYPIDGVMFRDITTLFQDSEGLREAIDLLVDRYKDLKIDKIAAIEARGFLLGAPLAYLLNIGLVLIRKPGKLPAKTISQEISEVLTVNGIRFSFKDGSWGLIRASSNKPSLVIVTESPTSNERKKKIFDFIDDLLQKTGKVGEYDQKI